MKEHKWIDMIDNLIDENFLEFEKGLIKIDKRWNNYIKWKNQQIAKEIFDDLDKMDSKGIGRIDIKELKKKYGDKTKKELKNWRTGLTPYESWQITYDEYIKKYLKEKNDR